jgi:hypothetical protein
MCVQGHSRRFDRRPTTSDLLRLADILRRTMTAFQRRLAGVARKLDQQQLLEPLGADVRVVVHLRAGTIMMLECTMQANASYIAMSSSRGVWRAMLSGSWSEQ